MKSMMRSFANGLPKNYHKMLQGVSLPPAIIIGVISFLIVLFGSFISLTHEILLSTRGDVDSKEVESFDQCRALSKC